MTQSPPPPQRNSKEFKALLSEWNKKLKESGLEDIEQPDLRPEFRGELRLKQWDALWFASYVDELKYVTKSGYYVKAEHFLNKYQFESPIDKITWQIHSEGYGVRQIAKALKELGVTTNKDKVNKVVQKLQKLMFKY